MSGVGELDARVALPQAARDVGVELGVQWLDLPPEARQVRLEIVLLVPLPSVPLVGQLHGGSVVGQACVTSQRHVQSLIKNKVCPSVCLSR